jgi:putative DNA primase/helicase
MSKTKETIDLDRQREAENRSPKRSDLPDVDWLCSFGFSVIPIRYGDKRPALKSWKEFMDRRMDVASLRKWFPEFEPEHPELNVVFEQRTHNVGIVTGSVSGIVVVDCDSEDAMTWADENMPHSEMRVLTGKGEHRYYRHPGDGEVRSVSRLRRDFGISIDVRGDGGYVVGPGSTHETGCIYVPRGTWPAVSELPVFDAEWVSGSRLIDEVMNG